MNIGRALTLLLKSVTDALEADGSMDGIEVLTLMPGNMIVLDKDCGAVWVRLASANPTVAFPLADLSPNNCAYSLAATIEVGLHRAGPVPSDFGTQTDFPTNADQTAAALRAVDDMLLLKDAIENAGIPQMILGSYTPQGPEGGTVGGVWTLTVGEDDD